MLVVSLLFLRIISPGAPLVSRAALAVAFCLWIAGLPAHANGIAHAQRQHAKIVHFQRHAVVHFRVNHALSAHSKGNADMIPGQQRLVFRDRGGNQNYAGSGEKNGHSREHGLRRADVNLATKTNKFAKAGKADPLLGSHATKYSQSASDKRLISATRALTRGRPPNVLGSHHKIKL
jgi:hypothetical protein